MENPAPIHLLIVDDEKNIRRTLSMTLKENRFQISEAASVEEALKLLQQKNLS